MENLRLMNGQPCACGKEHFYDIENIITGKGVSFAIDAPQEVSRSEIMHKYNITLIIKNLRLQGFFQSFINGVFNI